MNNTTQSSSSPEWEAAVERMIGRLNLESETHPQLQEIERNIAAASTALREYLTAHEGRGKFGGEMAARLRDVGALAEAMAGEIDDRLDDPAANE